MNMRRKAKKFATMFQFIVGATVLASCGKESTNINDNEINIETNVTEKSEGVIIESNENSTTNYSFEIGDSGISVYNVPEQTDVCDSEKETIMTDELYQEIKNRVEKSEYDCLTIHLESTPIDFSNIDVSNFTRLMIDCPNIDFNYSPFYNKTYEHLHMIISNKTNKEDVKKILQTATFNEAFLSLDFTENVSSDLVNEYLYVIANMDNLDWVDIRTSANINELNLASIKCNLLDISNCVDKELDYNITLNDFVTRFDLGAVYSKDYSKDVSLRGLKIKSNNKELAINFNIDNYDNNDFFVNIDNSTIIELPDNSSFDISGINVESVDDSWFKQFGNTSSTIIRNFDDYYDFNFYYNSSEGTINDAITDMHFEDLEKEVKFILETNGISTNINENDLIFIVYDNKNNAITDKKVYDYINALIRREGITKIDCGILDNQIDFNRIDLSNIEWVNISTVGYNFDYTVLKDTNRKPLENVEIYIQSNTNHRNKIEYLKTLNYKEGCNLAFVIDAAVDTNIISSYLNELDLTNLATLQISYLHINELDLSNINVPALYLNMFYYNKPQIDYEININENVEEVLLRFNCFVSESESTVKDIKVNSLNNDLKTYIYTANNTNNTINTINNCLVKDDSIISVPNNSKLFITGIEETSITDEFLQQFNNLDEFHITDLSGTYEYSYKKNREDWEFEKQIEKKLLKVD